MQVRKKHIYLLSIINQNLSNKIPIVVTSVALAENSSRQNESDSRHANAMRKRSSAIRKTIATRAEIEFDEDGSEVVEKNVTRNTDPNMFYANNLYKTLCIFCNKCTPHLVPHYVKEHPNHEVIISRVSQTMAQSIRAQSQSFQNHRNKITGICYFCQSEKSFTKQSWMSHILTHTGEPMYYCIKCNTGYKTKFKHNNCKAPDFKSIYDMDSIRHASTDGLLFGFMCNGCNYLQINENHLVKHLNNQHGVSEDVINHYEKIALLPDTNPIRSRQFEYKLLDEDIVSKCCICNVQLNDLNELQIHLDKDHTQRDTRINAYNCCCSLKEKVEGKSILHTMNHLYQHRENLFGCLSCNSNTVDRTYYFESAILNHLANEHKKDEWQFDWLHREVGKQTTVFEIKLIKFTCNACNEELEHVEHALDHFKVKHPTKLVNFKTIVRKKCSQIANKLSEYKTSSSITDKDYSLRQSFLCTLCDFISTSKEILMAHRNAKHTSSIFELKLGNPMLMNLNSAVEKCNEPNADPFIIFSCYWCYEKDNGDSFIAATAKEIHEHWQAEHSKQPFLFYPEKLVQCYYCDDVITTFKGMKKHFTEKHPLRNDEKWQIIHFINVKNNKKCPMCNFVSYTHELPKHIDETHNAVMELNIFNPNRLMQNEVDNLLKLNTKIFCHLCDGVYNTEERFQAHHKTEHLDLNPVSRPQIDSSVAGLIVGCCSAFIKPQNFYDHLRTHAFEYMCHECKESFNNIVEVAKHDMAKHNKNKSMEDRLSQFNRLCWKIFYGTKLYFGNGLVLYKHNLCGTNIDDSSQMENYLHIKDKEHIDKFNALFANSNHSED